MKRVLIFLAIVLVLPAIAMAQGGVKKRRPLPYEYGTVVMDNYSEKAGMAPVVFEHWVHRSMFTCRLCHVDIGFAMKAGETAVKAADNMKGYYCGSCHNGKMERDGKKVFASCREKPLPDELPTCTRCHSEGRAVKRDFDFDRLTKGLPKGRLGNGVDWDKAEEKGLIRLTDYIEGVSIKRGALKVEGGLSLEARTEGMPDIIFSHKKHAVWDGCELCHPDIFVSVKKGSVKYSMQEMFEGKYCGVCHGKVAFPLLDCQRCHEKPVQ